MSKDGKYDCDAAFYYCMRKKCDRYRYGIPGYIAGNNYKANRCEILAFIFYTAVSKKGQPFYDAAQNEACICVPPPQERTWQNPTSGLV
jgi:hypothetical protein